MLRDARCVSLGMGCALANNKRLEPRYACTSGPGDFRYREVIACADQ